MKPSFASLAAISIATLCAPATAAEVRLQSSMQDAIKVATRTPSVGTNVPRADIESRPLAPGMITEIVQKASAAALQSCGGGAVTVVATDLVSPDFVGDSVTRLSGMGLYITVSQRGHRGSGSGYIAPFVSMRLQVSGGSIQGSREIEITDFERIQIARADTLEFIQESPAEVARAVTSYASRVVEQRLRKELASACTVG